MQPGQQQIIIHTVSCTTGMQPWQELTPAIRFPAECRVPAHPDGICRAGKNYSFYTISGVLTGLFFLFGGIFLAILSSLVLIPIVPKQTEFKTEKIKFYDSFQGFMARCCSYEVVEPKLYIFEKHLGYIIIDRPINDDKDDFNFKNNTIIYKYELDNDGQTTVRDTTEILNFE